MRPIRTLDKLHYLIAGNYAGATTVLSHTLRSWGIVCGHEAIRVQDSEPRLYTLEGILPEPEDCVIDCGYYVSEIMNIPPLDQKPIIVLIRDPYDVLAAQIGMALDNGKVVDVSAIIGELLSRWTIPMASERHVLTVRIEDGLEDLKEFLGIHSHRPIPTKGHTHNRGRIRLDSQSLRMYPAYQELKAFARKHRYNDLL